jgi:hypothetical protein
MRMSHHVSFNAFYTYSKTMSSAQLYNSTTQGLARTTATLLEEYGAGDTDQRHIFSCEFTYQPDYFNKTVTPFCGTSSTAGASPHHQDTQRPPVHGYQRQR